MIDNEKEYHDWHSSVYFFRTNYFHIYIYIVYARDYDYSVVVSICRFSKKISTYMLMFISI